MLSLCIELFWRRPALLNDESKERLAQYFRWRGCIPSVPHRMSTQRALSMLWVMVMDLNTKLDVWPYNC